MRAIRLALGSRKVVGGWSLSGLGVFHTGHPLTVTIGLDPTQVPFGDSRANQRPDIVPGVPIVPPNQNPNNWVNIAAFIQPPTDANGVDTHFGDARNGIVRAPNVWEADIALQKSTKLGEKTALEFRAEAFNIFNHRQLGDPSHLDILSSSNFGQIDTPVSFNPNNDNSVEPSNRFGAAANLATFFPREVLATACDCRLPDTKFRLPALREGSSSLSRLAIRKDNDALLDVLQR